MARKLIQTPKLANGVARNQSESKYPHLWRDLVGLWVPSVGRPGLGLVDWSGNGHNGAFNGFTKRTDWKHVGLEYDGANTFVDCKANINPCLLTIHVVCLMYADADTGNHLFCGKYNNNSQNNRSFSFGPFGANDDNIRCVVSTGGDDFISYHAIPLVSPKDGKWHSWVMTWDGTVARIYRDSQEVPLEVAGSGGTTSGCLFSSDIPFYIGAAEWAGNGPNYFDGLIDTVALYDRVLSRQEILDLYIGKHPLEKSVSRRFFAIQPPEPASDEAGSVSVSMNTVAATETATANDAAAAVSISMDTLAATEQAAIQDTASIINITINMGAANEPGQELAFGGGGGKGGGMRHRKRSMVKN